MFQKNIFNSGNRVVSDLLSIVTSGTLYLQNKEADSHHPQRRNLTNKECGSTNNID